MIYCWKSRINCLISEVLVAKS